MSEAYTDTLDLIYSEVYTGFSQIEGYFSELLDGFESGAFLKWAMPNLGEGSQAEGEGLGTISDTVSYLGESMQASVLGPIAKMLVQFKNFGKIMKGSLGPLSILLEFLDKMGVFEPIFEIGNAFMDILSTAFVPLTQSLYEMLLPFLPLMQDLATALTPIIGAFAELITNSPSVQAALWVFTESMKILTDVFEFISPYIETVADFLSQFNLENIVSFLIDLPDLLGNFLDMVWATIANWFSGLWNRLVEFLDDIWDNFIDWLREVFT